MLADLLADLLAGYPGPVLVVSPAGALVHANTAARTLLAADPALWPRLGVWSRAAAASARPSLDARVEGATGRVTIEFTAVALGDGASLVLGRDITVATELRNALTESRQRYKELVEASSDFAWETGPDGCLVFVSPRGTLGYDADRLIGRSPAALLADPSDRELPLPFTTPRPVETDLWLRAANGEPVCLSISARPILGTDGSWLGARGVGRDITEEIRRFEALARAHASEEVVEHVFRALGERTDPDGALHHAASEAAHALGAEGCALLRIAGDGAFAVAATVDGPLDPAPVVARLSEARAPIELVDDGARRMLACPSRYRHEINGAICAWRPPVGEPFTRDDHALVSAIADRLGIALAHLAHLDRLRRLSERDGLTGLYNRRTFLERLAEVLDHADETSALLFVDLDNFKPVNDLHGHQRGDQVLREVAALVLDHVRAGDLAGRLGGDEFAIWLDGAADAAAAAVADRLLAASVGLRPWSVAPDRPVGLSIGIAIHDPSAPGGPETVRDLLARADGAMYQAKARGRAQRAIAAPATSDHNGNG